MTKKRNNDKLPDPHRMRTIAFRDGVQMQEVVDILNSPVLASRMPDDVKGYAGKANNGRRVLWAVRQLKILAEYGRLDLERQMSSDKAAEAERLEERIKQLEDLEDGYIKSINDQAAAIDKLERLLIFYRKVADSCRVVVDEEYLRYRDKDNQIGIWKKIIL